MHADVEDVSIALEELLRLFRRLNPQSGLSLTAAATLSSLDHGGPARLTELAAQQGVSQPAKTQLVTRLQEAGFAERVPDPADGRVVLVRVTDPGRAELSRRRAIRTDHLATLFDRLTEGERAALIAAVPAITALTGMNSDPRPATTGS